MRLFERLSKLGQLARHAGFVAKFLKVWEAIGQAGIHRVPQILIVPFGGRVCCKKDGQKRRISVRLKCDTLRVLVKLPAHALGTFAGSGDDDGK